MKPTQTPLPDTRLNRDQLLTIGDMEDFKNEILSEISRLLQEHVSPKSKKWLKSSEVRKLLGVSAGTLQTLRINGTLRYSKVGGLVFYPAEEIEKMMTSNLSE